MKEVEGTVTAEEALMCTYKAKNCKEIREWGLFSEREGLAYADGKTPFPNSLPLRVLTGLLFVSSKISFKN